VSAPTSPAGSPPAQEAPIAGAAGTPLPSSGIARAASRFGAATMLSRVLGLLREQLFAALVGAGGLADAFVVAFRIPNLLRDLFAEGALSAAFVPTFTDTLRNRSRAEAFALANRVVNTLALLLGVLVLFGMLFAESLVGVLAAQFPPERLALAVRLTRIMLPFLPVVSLAAVAMGMLTAQSRFGAPALAPTMFNIVSILVGAVLWAADAPPETVVVGWSIGTLLGGVAQLAIQLPTLRRTGWRYGLGLDLGLRDPGIRRIARLMGPATVGLAATQVNIVVNTYFATGEEGAAAWLSYAFRLMQLPIGIFGVAIATVASAGVAQRAAAHDLRGIDATVGTSLRLVAFFTIPATAVLAALGEPIVRLIYEYGRFGPSDTRQAALALLGYSLGLYAYAGVKVIAPTFYALNRPRLPLAASVAAVAVNLLLNVVLHPWLGFFGLAIGTSAAALTNFAVLSMAYRRQGGDLRAAGLASNIARVAIASTVAASAALFVARGVDHAVGTELASGRVLQTLGALSVGGLVYLAACRMLEVREVAQFVAAFRTRLRR
jgi:putative peptidoglycan lipid II flippase